MEALIGSSKAKCHVRSISLPARTHPLTTRVEEQLNRLEASEPTSSSACQKLGSLKELYSRVDDLLQLPLPKQVLSRERHSDWADNMLDGSLRLLDICGATRDVFSRMKECVQELESSLRRRRNGESSLENEVGVYLIFRKKLNKVISKSFRNLKRMEKCWTSAPLHKESKLSAAVCMLREVEGISLSVFESLLSFISQPKRTSKPGGWCMVSKLLNSRRVSSDESDANEVEKIDAELLVLRSSKKVNLEQVQKVLKGLEALELSIQEAEEELECAFRQLIKARVSLLNILNQ